MDVIASTDANVAATPLIAAGRASRLASILNAGYELLPHHNRCRSIGPADLGLLMTHAFGGSDADGFLSWKGDLGAPERAEVLFLYKFDTAIARVNAPEAALGLRLADVASLK